MVNRELVGRIHWWGELASSIERASKIAWNRCESRTQGQFAVDVDREEEERERKREEERESAQVVCESATGVERQRGFRFGFWSMPLASQLANILCLASLSLFLPRRGRMLGHARRTEADPWPILEIDSLRCPSSLPLILSSIPPSFGP